jgi:signal transduction histidine kinase/CheY-like chemotaxis protein/AraC-like DNA-binding protein
MIQANFGLARTGGLFRFNVKKHEFQLFNVSDGLQSNAFSENAACKGANGLMYFGGINGFNVFDPREKLTVDASPLSFISLRVMNEEARPGVKINDREILERSISYTDKITLTHHDKVVTFEVSSLNFTFSEKNQYAFKLEGFDSQWSNFQNTRSVTYTNLKPGTYTLMAKAGNTGNVWVGKPIALQITVLPPPWKTWWAYTLYGSVIIIIVYVIRAIEKKHLRMKEAVQAAGREKLKEKEISEMKFRFFTNVSHELKTPLTLIISPLEELLTLKDMSKPVREKLLLMHRHSGRLLALIHQLLDLRKAESGNMTLAVEQHDFVKFAFEVFESFTHLAERRNIAYSFHSEVDSLLIDFDENKIEMALTNIISNAFKYTPDAGKICCRIAVEKDSTLNKTFCNISVEDTGRGMPKNVLDKIFDLYYQVVVVDSVKISGTGIGLSLVKEIMQLHGGLVSVESQVGTGSKFTIKLPLKKVASNGSVPPSVRIDDEATIDGIFHKEISEEEKPLLLIIEDTDELRNYVASLLHDEFHVFQAASGEEGLKCALEKIPDIIISDVMMENMDGFELCNKVKNNVRTSHIPVILLTAKNMPESELSGLDAGADDYIKKPFNPIILIARVRRLLESRKQLKEYYSKKITLQPTNIEITNHDEKFLQKAMAYVEANLLNPDLSAESLGYEMAMSHSTLYRKLKALTGQSINEFTRAIRLKRAAQLLETGQYSVADAALQTGFSEVKYFRNYFKAQFGCLPSEYARTTNKSTEKNESEL